MNWLWIDTIAQLDNSDENVRYWRKEVTVTRGISKFIQPYIEN